MLQTWYPRCARVAVRCADTAYQDFLTAWAELVVAIQRMTGEKTNASLWPLLAGALGPCLTVVLTELPCFCWIFVV